jgi:chromate transporter
MIGLFTIGGGYAMIPLVRELVLKYNWMSETEFYNFLGVCESTPGPIAINMATYVGSTQGGLLGSIVSTLGVVLPSFIIIVLVASILKKVIKNKYFQAFLNGVKPVVIALIFGTGLMLVIKCMGFNSISEFNFDFNSFIIFILIAFTFYFTKYVFKKKLNAISLILISAALGLVISIL